MSNLLVKVSCVLLLSLYLTGCGSKVKERPSGTVAGTVTHNGQPVKAGLVNFESVPPGSAVQAELKDGKFKVDGPVFLGQYKVTVGPPRSAPPVPGETSPVVETPDIPKKYETAAGSDLSAEVKAGPNNFTFDLKP